ncbi:hypothetical protein Lqui_1698 [Legionella quinlivanii]|uniref:DUF1440 domain-containing protein n=1 Tax=Legionella quinlivanii TaxID=45073 RepID=A0A0W0Y0P3_9GAMM|nr:hypothetical protein [Legionella quinlivanii]KTD50373.1 hypothetical protein Lqui_1698 [Legionella quinlivanii]MCW8449876.1 hypothetical protein [Legionella quinlivanii]SEF42000.1 hypothetical protein SAMN02746093_00127 [Legionella quinlivanii DSM 21216]STY11973.1 Uncharacterised protein [Legionella quinlivanii]
MFSMKNVLHGIIAGIIAGIVFSFFLLMGGMVETLGAIIRMPTLTGGLLVHAIVSIITGIVFAVVFGYFIHSWGLAILLGLLFGLGMWIAGPMTLLPYMAAGTPLFSKWNLVDLKANIPPLVGHLVYGFLLGVVYYTLRINQSRV